MDLGPTMSTRGTGKQDGGTNNSQHGAQRDRGMTSDHGGTSELKPRPQAKSALKLTFWLSQKLGMTSLPPSFDLFQCGQSSPLDGHCAGRSSGQQHSTGGALSSLVQKLRVHIASRTLLHLSCWCPQLRPQHCMKNHQTADSFK